MGNRKRFVLGIIFFFLIGGLYAQPHRLTINEMFELADKNSKSIRMHELGVQEAVQAIKVARNGRLPSISAQMAFNYIGDGCMTDRDFSNGMHADMPHFGNSFVLRAEQTVYAGGSVSKNIEKSKLEKLKAEQEYQVNRQDLRFLLIGYYLDIYQLRNQQVVYEKNIEQTRLLVKDMKAAYRQGTALKSDITRYELQLQNLELALTSTKNRMNVLSYRLATTIGLDASQPILPDTTLVKRLTVQRRSEQAWHEESLNAPQLQVSKTNVRISENAQHLIKAERRPHISLTATNDFTGPILVEVPPLNNNFTYWFAGIGISYNIDALFKSNKKLKQARIATFRMEEHHRLVEEEIDNSIHAAYTDLDEAYVRLNTQLKSVQLAHENFNIVRQRYLNGLALITDMLDASNTQLDTELQLTNDQINILYQFFLLKKITGTL